MCRIPFMFVVVACLTLGLAPFTPEPHIWEKLGMLTDGTLVRAVDWFDLLMHGTPWLLLGVSGICNLLALRRSSSTSGSPAEP